jgi:hypothetical protein
MIHRAAHLDTYPRRRLQAARSPRSLAQQRAVWTIPRTWNPGELVTALMMNTHLRDNLNAVKSFIPQAFYGLMLRTHPDSDKAANQVALLALDRVVMNDGTRYSNLTLPLTADITVSGVGGLDTGSRVASTWYEVHLIGKSATFAAADLRLLLHVAKSYALDQSQATDVTTEKLRQGAADRVKLAQGFQATAKPIEFIDVKINKVGTPTGNIWFTLETDASGSPSGAVQATSDKLALATFTNSAQIVRIPFRTPFTPTAATQYHLVFQGDYTVSAVNYVQWQGDTANSYANGSAKKFDGTTWAAATPLDFWFKLYVATASPSLTFPSGYDQFAKLGHVYNGAGNTLAAYSQRDRVVRHNAINVLAGGNATIPTLIDLSVVVPPSALAMLPGALGTVAADGWLLMTGSDAMGGIDNMDFQTLTTSVADIQTHLVELPLDYQAAYYRRLSGTGTLSVYSFGYRW